MPRPPRSPLALFALLARLTRRAWAWALIAVVLGGALRAQARPLQPGDPAPAVSRRCWKHLVAERPSPPPELGLSDRQPGAPDPLVALGPPPVAPLLVAAPLRPRALPAAFFAGPAPPWLPVYLRLLQLVL